MAKRMKKRKRKRSKIRRPGQRKTKADESESIIHAFRTNRSDDITRYMSKMINKSEFIIEAIQEHIRKKINVTCPRCKGSGKIIKTRDTYINLEEERQ